MWKLNTLAFISAVIGITTLPTYADHDGPQTRDAGTNYRVFTPAPQSYDVHARGQRYEREVARRERAASRDRREHNRYERGPVAEGHRGHGHGPVVPVRTGFQWIPGCWDLQVEEICVEPERWEWQYVPAVIATRYDACGIPYTVVIKPACKERVLIPARYETHQKRVWIPGRWEPVDRCVTPVPVTRPHYERSGFGFRFSF